jgi:hypothetical protein
MFSIITAGSPWPLALLHGKNDLYIELLSGHNGHNISPASKWPPKLLRGDGVLGSLWPLQLLWTRGNLQKCLRGHNVLHNFSWVAISSAEAPGRQWPPQLILGRKSSTEALKLRWPPQLCLVAMFPMEDLKS